MNGFDGFTSSDIETALPFQTLDGEVLRALPGTTHTKHNILYGIPDANSPAGSHSLTHGEQLAWLLVWTVDDFYRTATNRP